MMAAHDTTCHFAPPQEAAALYNGSVMHARMKPKVHRFNYSVYSLMIDITRLEEAHSMSRFFSVGRFNLLSFHEKDHGLQDGSSLKDYCNGHWRSSGMKAEASRILLVCYPRVLGYTFNPISVYFGYDENNGLVGVIYEVRNTFGEIHTYVAPVQAGELNEAGLRQERDKLFYVSPFMDMPMRYRFRIRPPSDDCAIRIMEYDPNGPILAASFFGKRKALGTASLISAFCRIPLLPMKVVAGIHWEAAKLWFKGIRFFNRPAAPPPVSYNGRFANHSPETRSRQ